MKTSAKLATLGTLVACAGAASLPAALAAGPTAHASATTVVTLKDISFKPSTVALTRGASVRWLFKDGDTPHNVTFAHRHSRTQKSGTYTLRFAKAGTYRYHCTIHLGMDGRIIVR
jgi:plastocyanin